LSNVPVNTQAVRQQNSPRQPFEPWKGVTSHLCYGFPSCQFSACYPSILDLRSVMALQMDRRRPSTLNVPALIISHALQYHQQNCIVHSRQLINMYQIHTCVYGFFILIPKLPLLKRFQ